MVRLEKLGYRNKYKSICKQQQKLVILIIDVKIWAFKCFKYNSITTLQIILSILLTISN